MSFSFEKKKNCIFHTILMKNPQTNKEFNVKYAERRPN